MPPILALTLCTLFVFWLLLLERRQSPDVSIVSWVPTIWFLLIAGKPLAVWFGSSGADMEAGSPLDRIFIIVLLIIAFSVLSTRSFNWSSAFRNNIVIFVIISYMFISILWSDMPFTSFKRFTRDDIAPLIMSFLVMTEKSPRRVLESILRRIIYILIPFSMLLVKYYPGLGVQYGRWSGAYMWIGVAMQKNSLASLCLFATFFLSWTLIRRWRGSNKSVVWYQTYFEVYLLGLALWLFTGPDHRLNYSATSSAALLIGLLAFFGLSFLKKRKKLIGVNTASLLIGFIVFFGIVVPFAGGLFLSDAASAFGRSDTLTGRTDIWAFLIPYATSRPFLGHGYGGFWTDTIREATSSHAHNGYLDIMLNLGFIGFILFAIFFVSSSIKAQRVLRIDFDWGLLWFCIILMAVIHNMAESSTTSFTGTLASSQLMFYMSFRSYCTVTTPY